MRKQSCTEVDGSSMRLRRPLPTSVLAKCALLLIMCCRGKMFMKINKASYCLDRVIVLVFVIGDSQMGDG